ncbi:MAG: TIGR02453 family protein [Candidatus Kapabacteria bacterium]|nr:TIGR02453 family protein [Ignavibacteriota bacterium]MCW5883858.1 TIGR02453 family protein [Candidatus Kapabacteria bacterium]
MPKIKEFDRFSKDVEDFFFELSQNNNKEWFDINRSIYESEIKDKSKSFVLKVSELFEKNKLPLIADTKISLFRINRDIRFSKNKDPYKTNLGIFFPYSENPIAYKKEHSLGLYIHYEKDKSFIATGYHNPDSTALKSIRAALADDWEFYKSITENTKFIKYFPDEYAAEKPLKRLTGYEQNHPGADYMKKRDFSYGKNISDKIIFDESLPQFIIENAEASLEFMKFLYNAIYKN